MNKFLYILICIVFVASCKNKQAVVKQVPLESVPPNWVSARPNNGFKFIGIGMSDKSKNPNYQMEAKKNALYDLASEIKVDISTNSVLYTVQNNNQFSENFNSLIKLSNSDNIEGYTLVDTYENDKQYWLYYQLDKQEYQNLKAEKKKQIITKASNLIASALIDEQNKDFSSSLKKRIQAFGILTPYLNEEINFDPSITKGVSNIFNLTDIIQQQLQTITLAQQINIQQLKPYQKNYSSLNYNIELSNKMPLQNFPFLVSCSEEKIKVSEKAVTNALGELAIKVNYVEPTNQSVQFSLNPDISTLMSNDSVGKAGITLLNQFIQTPSLKAGTSVGAIYLYLKSTQKNLGIETTDNDIENYIKQKFSGEEIVFVDKPENSDFVIEAMSDTQKDVSSNVLENNYSIILSSLIINLELKKTNSGEVLFKNQVKDVYGYANSLEKAGLNAYSNPKLNAKLGEALFFMKRKIIVY